MKVFITGSNGFVGNFLSKYLQKNNISFVRGVRKFQQIGDVEYGDLVFQNNWDVFFKDIDVIVHLAARVHVMNESTNNSLSLYRKSNVEATLKIAKSAKEMGVKKFIFISSIKVNGETSIQPFNVADSPNPQDAYGISKMEAEHEIMKLHEQGKFEVTIIRPTLVYGEGVKANFAFLTKLVRSSCPLPFGHVKNKKSFVSLHNLADLILCCINSPNSSGRTFLVSDDGDLSLTELINKLSRIYSTHTLNFYFPVKIMKLVFTLVGKSKFNDRLFGNLQVDISHTKDLLNWKPPYKMEFVLGEKNEG